MNILIVYSHPNRESLNGAFLDKTLEGLKANDAVSEIEVLDLYGEGFDPLLVFNETKRRRDMHRDPSMKKYQEQILRADVVILIYPIWWGRYPAMLAGYIDRLFASDFAYRFQPGAILPEGMLKGRKVICISTMQGPGVYSRLFLANAHQVLMKRALFSFVGIRKVKFYEFGNMEKPEGKQKKYLHRIRNVMKNLRYASRKKKSVIQAR